MISPWQKKTRPIAVRQTKSAMLRSVCVCYVMVLLFSCVGSGTTVNKQVTTAPALNPHSNMHENDDDGRTTPRPAPRTARAAEVARSSDPYAAEVCGVVPLRLTPNSACSVSVLYVYPRLSLSASFSPSPSLCCCILYLSVCKCI